MDEQPSGQRTGAPTAIAIFVIVLLVIYFGSYYALVRPNYTGSITVSGVTYFSVNADFRSRPIELGLPFANHVELSQTLDILFVPAYRLDCMIRPHVWKPSLP